ncbi:MAG TPA: hypothetical protein VMZ30_17285 [Pyrinomonadaceae bacterium]|nr:hypothetical protein [Pyrinomonadaceae bacterium]
MRTILDRVVNADLDELKGYVQTVEDALEKQLVYFGNGGSKEENPEGVHRFAVRFPSLIRCTAFVHLYSLLECSLVNLCGHVRKFGSFRESVNDTNKKQKKNKKKDKKHNKIVAARTYLKDVAKVILPEGAVWRDVLQMIDIRNAFVHGRGRIREDKITKELKQYAKRKNPLIEIDGIGRINLRNGYCQDAIEVVRQFFNATLKSIPEKFLREEAKRRR